MIKVSEQEITSAILRHSSEQEAKTANECIVERGTRALDADEVKPDPVESRTPQAVDVDWDILCRFRIDRPFIRLLKGGTERCSIGRSVLVGRFRRLVGRGLRRTSRLGRDRRLASRASYSVLDSLPQLGHNAYLPVSLMKYVLLGLGERHLLVPFGRRERESQKGRSNRRRTLYAIEVLRIRASAIANDKRSVE